jgi:hypothetical protein
MAYEPILSMGRGVNYHNQEAEGNPFEVEKAVVTAKPTTDRDDMKKSIVTDAYEQAKSFEANASASFSGWGASVKAKMAMKNENQLKQNEVKFIASRTIRLGYTGW